MKYFQKPEQNTCYNNKFDEKNQRATKTFTRLALYVIYSLDLNRTNEYFSRPGSASV